MIQVGEIYRVFGSTPGSYADIRIAGINEHTVFCERTDGQIVEMERKLFDRMRKTKLDQTAVYGQGCVDGRYGP